MEVLIEEIKHLMVEADSYRILKIIGKGKYGKVELAEEMRGPDKGTLRAIKTMLKQGEEMTAAFTKEITIMNAVRNAPFLAQMVGYFIGDHGLNIVMTYYGGGDLRMLIQHTGRMTNYEVAFYAAQMSCGLKELHERNIVHRDLKPTNVFMSQDGHLSIADFGLSDEISSCRRRSIVAGTPYYMAPEVYLRNFNQLIPADWWSFGVIVYELTTGSKPFMDPMLKIKMNKELLKEAILTKDITFNIQVEAPLRDFIEKLLLKNPEDRLGTKDGFEEVRSHAFLRNCKWDHKNTLNMVPPFTVDCEGKYRVNKKSIPASVRFKT